MRGKLVVGLKKGGGGDLKKEYDTAGGKGRICIKSKQTNLKEKSKGNLKLKRRKEIFRGGLETRERKLLSNDEEKEETRHPRQGQKSSQSRRRSNW